MELGSNRGNMLRDMKLCRFCLDDKGPFTNIYEKDVRDGIQQIPLPLQIMACVAIEVFSNDGMPQLICNQCRSQTIGAYNFKSTCKKADDALKLYLATGNKKLLKPQLKKRISSKNTHVEVHHTSKPKHQQQPPPPSPPPLTAHKRQQPVKQPPPPPPPPPPSKHPSNLTKPRSKPLTDSTPKPHLFTEDEEEEEEEDVNDPLSECHAGYAEDNTSTQQSQDVATVHIDGVGEVVFDQQEEQERHQMGGAGLEDSGDGTEGEGAGEGGLRYADEEMDYDEYIVGQRELKGAAKTQVTASGIFPCTVCERSFPLMQQLDLHMKNHDRVRNFSCGQMNCGRMFFNKYDLAKHAQTHFDYKPFTCVVCEKTFARESLLHRHEKVHVDVPKYLCTQCDRTFLNREDYDAHSEKHKKRRPFQCRICYKSFVFKQGLDRHEITHADIKPHKCNYCEASFTSPIKLMRHITSHAGLRPYPCRLCGRTFLLSHHLTRHLRSHNPGAAHALDPVGLHKCDVCSMSFRRKDSLINHTAIHSMVNLKCVICNTNFDSAKQVKEHITSHLSGLPYPCDKCDYSFETQDQLEEHELKHAEMEYEDQIEAEVCKEALENSGNSAAQIEAAGEATSLAAAAASAAAGISSSLYEDGEEEEEDEEQERVEEAQMMAVEEGDDEEEEDEEEEDEMTEYTITEKGLVQVQKSNRKYPVRNYHNEQNIRLTQIDSADTNTDDTDEDTVQPNTLQHNTMQHAPMQQNNMQHNTMQHAPMQHSSMQSNVQRADEVDITIDDKSQLKARIREMERVDRSSGFESTDDGPVTVKVEAARFKPIVRTEGTKVYARKGPAHQFKPQAILASSTTMAPLSQINQSTLDTLGLTQQEVNQMPTKKYMDMKVGDKTVRVQKLIMTKAEIEAMAKEGKIEMKGGNIILKKSKGRLLSSNSDKSSSPKISIESILDAMPKPSLVKRPVTKKTYVKKPSVITQSVTSVTASPIGNLTVTPIEPAPSVEESEHIEEILDDSTESVTEEIID